MGDKDGPKVIDFREAKARKSAREDPVELTMQITWTEGSYRFSVTDHTTNEDPGPDRLREAAARLQYIIARLEAEAIQREQGGEDP
jgi:hypothetical protein